MATLLPVSCSNNTTVGAPQLGHAVALAETSFLQSGHVVNPVLVTSTPLQKTNGYERFLRTQNKIPCFHRSSFVYLQASCRFDSFLRVCASSSRSDCNSFWSASDFVCISLWCWSVSFT